MGGRERERDGRERDGRERDGREREREIHMIAVQVYVCVLPEVSNVI